MLNIDLQSTAKLLDPLAKNDICNPLLRVNVVSEKLHKFLCVPPVVENLCTMNIDVGGGACYFARGTTIMQLILVTELKHP